MLRNHTFYHIGETLTVFVEPGQGASVYCLYQDATGAVVRIPPKHPQPDLLLHAGAQEKCRPERQLVRGSFHRTGVTELIGCLGINHEIRLKLPYGLRRHHLEPVPVAGLDEIAAHFREISGLELDDARLTVEVVP